MSIEAYRTHLWYRPRLAKEEDPQHLQAIWKNSSAPFRSQQPPKHKNECAFTALATRYFQTHLIELNELVKSASTVRRHQALSTVWTVFPESPSRHSKTLVNFVINSEKKGIHIVLHYNVRYSDNRFVQWCKSHCSRYTTSFWINHLSYRQYTILLNFQISRSSPNGFVNCSYVILKNGCKRPSWCFALEELASLEA